MFSEEWDFDLLNEKADQIIVTLEQKGFAKYLSVPGEAMSLPASANIETVQDVVIVASGYPERAGVWAYTLLDQSLSQPEALARTTMEPYFQELPEKVGLVVLNPNGQELKRPPEASIPIYLEQLHHLYEYFLGKEAIRLVILGYSLGGDVMLRFLQERPDYAAQTHGLIFIDPTPPSIGRRKLKPEVVRLVDEARFYGLCKEDGMPGEFAEFTKMRLKIKPELVVCDTHGAMPNLLLPRLLKEFQSIFA